MKCDLNFLIKYVYSLRDGISLMIPGNHSKLKPVWKYIPKVEIFVFGKFILIKDNDDSNCFFFKMSVGASQYYLKYSLNSMLLTNAIRVKAILEWTQRVGRNDIVMTFPLDECCYILDYIDGDFLLNEEKCLEVMKRYEKDEPTPNKMLD